MKSKNKRVTSVLNGLFLASLVLLPLIGCVGLDTQEEEGESVLSGKFADVSVVTEESSGRSRTTGARRPPPLMSIAEEYFRDNDDEAGLATFIENAKKDCPREKKAAPASRQEARERALAAVECLMGLPLGEEIFSEVHERLISKGG